MHAAKQIREGGIPCKKVRHQGTFPVTTHCYQWICWWEGTAVGTSWSWINVSRVDKWSCLPKAGTWHWHRREEPKRHFFKIHHLDPRGLPPTSRPTCSSILLEFVMNSFALLNKHGLYQCLSWTLSCGRQKERRNLYLVYQCHFLPTWHKAGSFERSGPQLRKHLHKTNM